MSSPGTPTTMTARISRVLYPAPLRQRPPFITCLPLIIAVPVAAMPPTAAPLRSARRVRRVAGLTGARTALVTSRPFRAPHHTIPDVGRIGGHLPLPGEVSLAHPGVRFWDERPACRRHVREVLRQPLTG